MDRISAYADWLVKNQDKKGTPDFETVAKAYRELRLEEDPFLAIGNQQPVEKQSVFRQVADVPIGIARGAAQGVRMIADAFGPDNVVSQAYRGMEDYLGELYSAQAQNNQKKIAQIMKDAEDKGIGDQLIAAVKAFTTAPVDMLSQALGTAAPIVVGGLAGSVARLGAVGVGAVQTGLGAAMGAGTVKGTIYEAVKSALTDSGEDPRVAEQKAREAQSYTGENWGQVLAGTVLGGVAGRIGVEDLLLKRFTQKAAQEGAAAVATPGVLRRAVTAGGTEAVPEMAQAGQEQLAENIALQRQGFDVPTMRGVAGQAALEGLAGFGLGAGLGAMPGPKAPTSELDELRKKLAEAAQTSTETVTPETEIEPEKKKKEKRLKLEDLNPAGVEELRAELAKHTTDEGYRKEANAPKFLINKLILAGVSGDQLKAFKNLNIDELINAATKFVTPKEEQGEQLDQLDQSAGGEGAGISGEPGAGTTAAGTTAPSGVGVGGAPDASQQAGVGAEPPDTTLTTPPTTPPATPPSKQEAIVQQAQEEFNRFDTALRQQQTKLDSLKGQESTPEYKQTFDNIRYLATQRSNAGAQLSQAEVAKQKAEAEAKAAAEKPVVPTSTVAPTAPTKSLAEKAAAAKAAFEARKKAAKGNLSISAFEEARISEIESDVTEEELDFIRDLRSEISQNKAVDPEIFNIASDIFRSFDESRYAQQRDRVAALYEDAVARGAKDIKARGLPKLFRDLTSEEIKAGETKGGKLTADEREVFVDALGKDLTPANATKALTKLSDYRDKKKVFTDEAGERSDIVANSIAAYEINRRIESKIRKISLPSFIELTNEEQTAYLNEAPLKGEVTGEQVIKGFDALQDYNESLGTEPVTKEEIEEGRAETAYQKAQREIQAEKLGMAGTEFTDERGRPLEIQTAAKQGDINAVINYLASKAKGFQKNQPFVGTSFLQTISDPSKYIKLSGAINRGIAGLIRDLGGIDTKLRYIPTLAKDAATRKEAAKTLRAEGKAFDFIADYDPRTDTLTITDRALNETALMHELIHAVTVKMMYRYLTGKREGMSDIQKQAAQNIIKIYNTARQNTSIKSSFPNAFENVYEFLSYSLSDPNMQTALRRMPSPIKTEKLPSAWSSLVDKIAELLGIKGLLKKLRITPKEFIPSTRKQLYNDIQELRDKVEEKTEPSLEDIEDLEELETIAEQEYQIPDVEIQEIEYGKSGRKKGEKRATEKPKKISRQEYESRINRLVDAAIAIGRGDTSAVTQTDVANVELNEENALFQLMANFEQILSPPEAITDFDKTLRISDAEANKSISENKSRLVDKLDQQNPTLATKTKSVASMFSKDSRTKIIETMQNYRYRVDRLNDVLLRTKKLISSGPKQNSLGSALTLSSGKAESFYQKNFFVPISEANDMLADLAKSMKSNATDVLSLLHLYVIHKHDPERREVKYLREVPLVDNDAIIEREKILREVIEIDIKALGEAAAKEKAKDLRKKLEAHVKATKVEGLALSDINNEAYNTLGPYNIKDIEAFGRAFSGENKVKADLLLKKLTEIENKTIELNKKANYFSPPVQNLVNFYGFENYFPFSGRPESGPNDYKMDIFGANVSGDLQDKQEAFDGRITDSENPILNVLSEASKSAMRLGRHEAGVTLSIKNLIDSKIIAGRKIADITFAQRFNNKLSQELKRGEKNIFHHMPDGTIQIYEIDDRQMLQAIKRPFKEDNWFIDSVGKATSLFGQMHTRFNPAFAPMDFARNLFTYAGVLGAETSGKRGLQVIGEMSSIVARNGFGKTAKFSLAFSRGNEAEMNRLAKTDSFYADLKDFYDIGGRVAYLQGITISDNLSDVVNSIQKNGMIKSLSGVNKFFDAWLDMFEMSSRIAAYRTMRDQYVANGMPLEQAKIEAVAYAKNLANFEKTGIKGKEIGAFFMFFRPAATGAVRAYQALSPALDYFKSDEELKKIVTKEAEDVKGLKAEDINRLVADYRKRAHSAAIVSGALFGLGAATFLMAAAMAGDDDEGRNKTLSDDTARWVRTARFNTGIQSGGKDLVIQIPWGFGPGAFAAVGAQLAAFVSGASSFGQFINNVLDAGAESFMPIPISKINKLEHPVEAALDSVLPSALKPLFEWAMNMDGLGREIYNNRQSRNNDAYTGGDNIPEIFKDAVRLVYNMSDGKVDVSPNTLYFFLNNYLDGMSRLGAWGYNMAHTVAGNRDFDFKTDTLLLDSYLKAPSNYDARQFSEVEKQIKDMERRYRAFTSSGDAERIADYFQEHPYDKSVIDYYNKFNGQLNKLRELANKTRTNTNLTIKERQDQVRVLIDNQNKLKSAFVQSVAAYGIEPD